MPSSVSNFPVPPLHGYRGEAPTPPPLTRPEGLTVAISREAGARGWSIAKKVGELLNWQFFDTETLDYLVQDESARHNFLAEVPVSARAWAAARLEYLRTKQQLNGDPDTIAMIELVLAVAARGESVIVGRGAGFLLPPETTVHIRVIAPLDSRVAYFAQSLRLTREEATAELQARDERRSQFVTSTLGRDPANPTGYDAIINVGRLGIEGAAQFIQSAVRTKQMLADLNARDEES
ncbi:MAG TPA: cytidylate kinase-like family protein [Gemmata sp.]|nr:cytidylate kinase-like family protein [Gemmata sp.]